MKSIIDNSKISTFRDATTFIRNGNESHTSGRATDFRA